MWVVSPGAANPLQAGSPTTARPTSGPSSDNLLKGLTPLWMGVTQDTPVLPSQGSRGIRRNRKSKDRRHRGDFPQCSVCGTRYDLSPKIKSHSFQEATFIVKPSFSPSCAAAEGTLHTPAEYSTTEPHVQPIAHPPSHLFVCVVHSTQVEFRGQHCGFCSHLVIQVQLPGVFCFLPSTQGIAVWCRLASNLCQSS